MKKVLVELYYNDVEEDNEDICYILEHEVADIEGVMTANVVDIRNYNDYETDIENYSHYNFGYEN